MAKTKNGQFILSYLEKYAGIYSVDKSSDVIKMAENRARRNYYLEMVHQFIHPANHK